MKPTIDEIETLARGAGEILRAGYQGRPGMLPRSDINFKGEIDLVTEFDHAAEAYLIGAIQARYPNDSLVAEESGLHQGEGGAGQWFIDPLDGTVNFAHGVPIFCVSVAYAHSGVLEMGVVYDPIHDECFSAVRGQGACLNGQPLRVSHAIDLNHSLLVTGFPYNIRENPRNNLDFYAAFALRSQGVRRLGSAALDLCYIAAGRFDGYWELLLKPWDMAAGMLIAQEAGAQVSAVDGRPVDLSGPASVLAAAPQVYPEMFSVLNGE